MRGRSTGLLSRFREAGACGWEGWGSPGRYVESQSLGYRYRLVRHARGYAPANDTRALHRNIQHTVRYTELSPTRFKDFWRS